VLAWDSRGHTFRTEYDPLRRPTDVHLTEGAAPEVLVLRTVYGESRPNAAAANLRGQVYQVLDGAGELTTDDYDFKGPLKRSKRRLAVEYKRRLDWSGSVPFESGPPFETTTQYDALSRPTQVTTPDESVLRPVYNEANLLERLEGNLRGSATVTRFVDDVDYNEKGQRTLIAYGNGARTTYEYDAQTFRLTRLSTTRATALLQDLAYTYDPVGNITHIEDAAQQTIFFNNRRVEPSADYTYDAVYRLIEATGREHLGQPAGGDVLPSAPSVHPSDGNAMGRYSERYSYDEVGNILELFHAGQDPARAPWKRSYIYSGASLLEPARKSNRLTSTTIGVASEPYAYDAHGNMTVMPHLPVMRWDEHDQLRATARQSVSGGTPEMTYYVYDAGGQRVRKVTERQAVTGAAATRMKERIYVGSFETYREFDAGGAVVSLERQTVHVEDDTRRVALVETRTLGMDPAPAQLTRYQLRNHLGSSSIELDASAQIISYEEYFPYGGTSYQAVRSQTDTPKRYRYAARERDEESGLHYHGVRYYAPWLGRWASCDRLGTADGVNVYSYCRANPILRTDPSGMQSGVTLEGSTHSARLLTQASPPQQERKQPSFWARWAALPEQEKFGFQMGCYPNSFIDKQVAAEYASTMQAFGSLESVAYSPSYKAGLLASGVFHYVGYFAAALFYEAEHTVGTIAWGLGGILTGIDEWTGGFVTGIGDAMWGFPLTEPLGAGIDSSMALYQAQKLGAAALETLPRSSQALMDAALAADVAKPLLEYGTPQWAAREKTMEFMLDELRLEEGLEAQPTHFSNNTGLDRVFTNTSRTATEAAELKASKGFRGDVNKALKLLKPTKYGTQASAPYVANQGARLLSSKFATSAMQGTGRLLQQSPNIERSLIVMDEYANLYQFNMLDLELWKSLK